MSEDVQMMMEVEAGMPPGTPGLLVGFTLHAEQDGNESAKEGRPVFRDREYVKIIIPGDKQTEMFQPAEESHRRRFPQAYARFKAAETAPLSGTPIEQWAAITRSQAAYLKAANVPTIEALADVSDVHIGNLGMGGRELRTKAQAWIAEARGPAAVAAIAAENEKLRRDIAMLQEQIADLGRLQDPQKRGPGRPRKVESTGEAA